MAMTQFTMTEFMFILSLLWSKYQYMANLPQQPMYGAYPVYGQQSAYLTPQNQASGFNGQYYPKPIPATYNLPPSYGGYQQSNPQAPYRY